MKIYPNPVRETIKISQLPLNFSIKEIFLIDVTGRNTLIRNNFSANQQDLTLTTAQLKQGTYLLRITGSNGKSITRKIVKLKN